MESIPTHAKDDKDGQSNKVVVENAQTDNTSTNDLCIYICNITNDLHIYIYKRYNKSSCKVKRNTSYDCNPNHAMMELPITEVEWMRTFLIRL